MQADREAIGPRLTRQVIVLAILVAGAGLAVTQSAYFTVRKVDISGLRRLDSAEVLAVGGVRTPFNVFHLNPKEVQRKLASYPPLATASVVRALPNRLVITVTERAPVGAIPYGRHLMLFDARGIPFAIQKNQPSPPVPVLIGMKPVPVRLGEPTGSAEVALAARLVAGLPREIEAQVGEVDLSDTRKITLTLVSGAQVDLGSDAQIERKVAVLKSVLVQIQAQKWDVGSINLTAPDDPVVKLGGVTQTEEQVER